MKEIKLNNNLVAFVSDEDYEWLSQWKWYGLRYKHTTYAVRTEYKKDSENRRIFKRVWMHRLILNLTDRKIQGDHKDRNGLNNQRDNLRVATQSQNNANRNKNSSSQYLGISYYKKRKAWRVSIRTPHGHRHSNDIKNETEAALLYNKWATEIHGEFANLNKIQ